MYMVYINVMYIVYLRSARQIQDPASDNPKWYVFFFSQF